MARKRTEVTESTSVEETIENAPGLEPGEGAVQSTTEETPREADETSAPNSVSTEIEAPPVSTTKPDVPVAQVLTAGAGAHTPPDPDEYDSEGRPRREETESQQAAKADGDDD
jgi:hypothetical protein